MNSDGNPIDRIMMKPEVKTTSTDTGMLDFLQKVLVIRLGAFGDVVRTIPAVDALKKRYLAANITWLVDEDSANILEKLECIDSVIALSRRGFLRDFAGAVKALREIRRCRFTCVLDFHGLSRSGLFSFLSGCKHRVGFARGHVREFNSLFNNMYVDPGTELISRYEKNHSLVELFHVPPKTDTPVINLPEEEQQEIDSFIASLKNSGFVCLHPGTSRRGRYKRWYPQRFAKVADIIVEKYGLDIVLLFTDEEKDIVDVLISKARSELRISPKLNQRQLAYLIGRSSLYVGLDSGSMHVASLMKIPIVALFGPSDVVHNRPHNYAPYRIVHGDAECSPCRKRNCSDRICMDAIQPQHVIESIDEIMQLGNR